MTRIDRPSPLELAKRLKAIKAITASNAELAALAASLVLPDENERVQSILEGLGNEDEFALLCRSMCTCETICSLDQTPVIDNPNIQPPDFLAVFRPALSWLGDVEFPPGSFYRCLIEVKGTQKYKHGCSKKDLTRRLNFADLIGLPLVFAVRFTRFAGSLWLLMEAETYQTLGRKVRPEDLQNGIGHVLLDDYFIGVQPNVRMKAVYDSVQSELRVSEYGSISELTFFLGDKEISVQQGDCPFVYIVLGCLDKNVLEIQSGESTTVIYDVPPQGRAISNIMTYMNELLVSPDGKGPVDRGQILARLDNPQSKPYLFTRPLVESVFKKYWPIFGRYALEGPELLFPKMERLFGVR